MKLFKKKSKGNLYAPSSDLPSVHRKPPIQPDQLESKLAMPKPIRILMKEVCNRPEYEKTQVECLPFSSSVHSDRTQGGDGQTTRSFSMIHPMPAVDSHEEDNESDTTYRSARASLSTPDSTDKGDATPPEPDKLAPSKPNSPAVNTDDRGQLLQALKARIVRMERQRASEMAERQRMERDWLDNKREMMEALIETQRQLTLLLKQTVRATRSSSVSNPEASLAGRRLSASVPRSQGHRAKRPEWTRLSSLDAYEAYADVPRYPVSRVNRKYQ
ncbi:hypothetical protein G6F36_013885 [Rhizopus arrhizus]|nr:hypothetical protein G6F36_013885 [Rhizopus arrhizus]